MRRFDRDSKALIAHDATKPAVGITHRRPIASVGEAASRPLSVALQRHIEERSCPLVPRFRAVRCGLKGSDRPILAIGPFRAGHGASDSTRVGRGLETCPRRPDRGHADVMPFCIDPGSVELVVRSRSSLLGHGARIADSSPRADL
jgi:hypothetical protein